MTPPWYSRTCTARWLLLLFALVFAAITFPNHYLIRTHALDLGVYTHVLWHYAHLSLHDSTSSLNHAQPILADHFDLYLALFSPLVYVFGTWTLLIVQWVAIVLGAWGTYRFLCALQLQPGLALVGLTIFLLYFGLFAALSFDYHSNVVATMVLPWFLLAVLKGRRWRSFLLMVFMLMAKENMGIWLGVVALVLSFESYIPRSMRWFTVMLGGFAFTWSVVLLVWVMPTMSVDTTYMHFDYGILGERLADVPAALIDHPGAILKAFFVDHIGHYEGTEIKLEFWWMMLLAGGWAFFAKPRWGLMALPLIAQKMLHNDVGKWSVSFQYSVEFAPLIAIAVCLVFTRITTPLWRSLGSGLVVVASLITAIRFMDNTYAGQNRDRIRFYQARHYSEPYELGTVRAVLASIPDTAAVSTQSTGMPQLALRERIYLFPLMRDADHIVLLPLEGPYPLNDEQFAHELQGLMRDPRWQLREHTKEVIHFVRRPIPAVTP